MNAKFKIGDEVLIINYHERRTVARAVIVDWRGGGVAPYSVEVLEGFDGYHKPGLRFYKSGRDMQLAYRKDTPMSKYLTTDEKLDLLLEHLGLKIEAEPRIIKAIDEEARD